MKKVFLLIIFFCGSSKIITAQGSIGDENNNLVSKIILKCNFPDSVNLFEKISYKVFVENGEPPFTFKFNFGDSTETISTDNEWINHIYKMDGKYKIKVMVTDNNGSLDSCTNLISTKINIFIPNVIKPNHDDKNDVFNLFIRSEKGYVSYKGFRKFNMKIKGKWGETIFQTDDSLKGWYGSGVKKGVYYYWIELGNEKFKGWIRVLL